MQKPLKSPLTKNPRFVDEIKDDKVRDERRIKDSNATLKDL